MEMLNLLLHNTSAKFPLTVALIFEHRFGGEFRREQRALLRVSLFVV
jgi:hypothetical protein